MTVSLLSVYYPFFFFAMQYVSFFLRLSYYILFNRSFLLSHFTICTLSFSGFPLKESIRSFDPNSFMSLLVIMIVFASYNDDDLNVNEENDEENTGKETMII